ncbi:MAG: RnfABCDGE type electron transport complex subunit G [Firmicutes bacterium]|nr:RnfABCDGE type electron transport complex subunit G [Bacillota bacterium]
MGESTRMIIVLTVICMISAGVLAWAYNVTYEPILANRARALHSSIFQVLPGAEDVRVIEARPTSLAEDDEYSTKTVDSDQVLLLYQGLNANGKSVGFAYLSEETGYGGIIQVLIGVDENTEKIVGVTVVEHSETAGIGTKIEEEGFKSQFIGKGVNDPITIGIDIDSITGSTVSSEAMTKAINKNLGVAIQAYREAK